VSPVGFFDREFVYMTPGLLTTDGVHLSQRGKRIFAQHSAGLLEGALNYISRGKRIKPGSLEISQGAGRHISVSGTVC